MSTAVSKTDVPQSKTLDQYAKAIRAARGKTNELLIEVARNLKLAHDELSSHDKTKGKFGKWVESHCHFTVQTAQKYLLVLKAFDGACLKPGFKHIDQSALYYLSKDTTPEEALSDSLSAAESGEHITLKRAKEFAEQYTVDAESSDPETDDSSEDSEWDDEPADLSANWSPAACILGLRPEVAKWAKSCPAKSASDLAQILRDLAEQVEKGVWHEC